MVAERLFRAALDVRGLPQPEAEYHFAKPRKWRFDYAFPVQRVAVEVEGGVWIQGRHTRGAGFLADIEKYNESAARGWRVVRCTPDTLLSRDFLNIVERTLHAHPG